MPQMNGVFLAGYDETSGSDTVYISVQSDWVPPARTQEKVAARNSACFLMHDGAAGALFVTVTVLCARQDGDRV